MDNRKVNRVVRSIATQLIAQKKVNYEKETRGLSREELELLPGKVYTIIEKWYRNEDKSCIKDPEPEIVISDRVLHFKRSADVFCAYAELFMNRR